jgi:hypothetical protein
VSEREGEIRRGEREREQRETSGHMLNKVPVKFQSNYSLPTEPTEPNRTHRWRRLSPVRPPGGVYYVRPSSVRLTPRPLVRSYGAKGRKNGESQRLFLQREREREKEERGGERERREGRERRKREGEEREGEGKGKEIEERER